MERKSTMITHQPYNSSAIRLNHFMKVSHNSFTCCELITWGFWYIGNNDSSASCSIGNNCFTNSVSNANNYTCEHSASIRNKLTTIQFRITHTKWSHCTASASDAKALRSHTDDVCLSSGTSDAQRRLDANLNEESPGFSIYSVANSFAASSYSYHTALSLQPSSNPSQVPSTQSTTRISVASITVQRQTHAAPRGTSHESAQQTGRQPESTP